LLARENLVQGKVPTTPTAASIIAGVQTQEALKLIHGMEVQPGVSFVFNGLTNDNYATRLPVKVDCLSHAALDEIIEIPEARADRSTLADLLVAAQERLGGQARVSLGYDLVVNLRCRRCETEEAVLKPLHRLTEREARCVRCGDVRMPDVVSEFSDQESVVRGPLQTLGVPPLAILPAYTADRVIGLELTGDVDTCLVFH
jgi:adenylyltransferase/sulfurtransferase